MPLLSGFVFLMAALFPVESIQVEGLKRLKAAQVVAASGLKLGTLVDKLDFDKAQQRLLATGNLASVAYRFVPTRNGEAFALTFDVVEIDQVFPIAFEDLAKPDAELLRVLAAADPLFTNPAPGTEAVIQRYQAALQAVLQVKPGIVGKILADQPGQEALIFRPNVPRPTVATVAFTGNKIFSTPELQNRAAAVAVGTLYTEERFRELLLSQVRPMYEEFGLLAVSFPKVTAKPATDVEGMDVTVEVNEGPAYKLSNVLITGVPDVAEAEKTAGFKSDAVFRLKEVTEGMERLRAMLRSEGYMKVAAEATRKYDHDKKTIALTVAVTLGPQYRMGKLTIQGLDINTEPEIRKMWGLREGSPFRELYPKRFLSRIRDEGVLDGLGETKSTLDYDEARKIIHVTLVFGAVPKVDPKEAERKRRRQQQQP